jgi:hypothetical protein
MNQWLCYSHSSYTCNKKHDIHQLRNQIFQQTPVMDTRLIIGNRNSRNVSRELVHRHSQLNEEKIYGAKCLFFPYSLDWREGDMKKKENGCVAMCQVKGQRSKKHR